MLVDRGENKGYVIQGDQVRFGNHIAGHLFIDEDIFFMARQPLVGQGFLIVEGSRSHSNTPHSVGLLLMRDIHAPGGIRSRNPSKRAVADPRLRQYGHWNRHWWRGCKHEQERWTKTDILSTGLRTTYFSRGRKRIWFWSLRLTDWLDENWLPSFCNRQIMMLPRKTKTYTAKFGPGLR
jgi:hypothetical protein